MSLLIQYLVKLSISLAIVWLFYQFILRRLTFYDSNRWYLLVYSLLSFFIPFINIANITSQNDSASGIIQFIPSVHQYTVKLEEASHCPVPIWSTNYDKWDFAAFGLIIVAIVLFFRFLFRYISFLRVKSRSTLLSSDGFRIYHVDDHIIPFSFGNSVFINTNLHTKEELQEIVRHEFVHVRQNHTIDIIWAELLCIVNWYNPFAWMLKRSIRQNLEFIADNKVIEHGIDKKQYQYLLLKVIGNSQYSIATQFNFSSLKKRIVMMNKTKSARRQLGRFLFLIPVLAIILLSFRQSISKAIVQADGTERVISNDSIPVNSKGYIIEIADDNGNCTVVVKDKNKKEVKRVLLTEWNARPAYYENLYGKIPMVEKVEEIKKIIKAKNPDIRTVTVKDNTATVTLKDGTTETYTLSIKEEKEAFEERCRVKEVAMAETAIESEIANPVERVTEVTVAGETIAEDFEITDKKAVMRLKNGKIEKYDLTNEDEKAAFEKRFGKIIKVAPAKTDISSVVATITEIAEPSVPIVKELPTIGVTILPEETVPTMATPDTETPTTKVTAYSAKGKPIGSEKEVLFTITKKTTEKELESLKMKMKELGMELTLNEVRYENGQLVRIKGTLKSNESSASFNESNFGKLVVARVKEGEKSTIVIEVIIWKKTLS